MTDLFSYTYTYGNGDSYSGYGHAGAGTYYTNQYIGFNDGYYYISSVASGYSSTVGSVTVNSYYDYDTGYGYAGDVSGSGDYGLGSESGNAYNHEHSNTSSYFGGGYYEADLGTDLYYFTYNYGNGDSYSGYGYADTGTYYTDQYIGYNDGYYNETGYDGYYYISSVFIGYGGTAGSVTVDSYYDYDTGYGYAGDVSGSGDYGLGSESGNAYNYSYSNIDSVFGQGYYEADLYNSTVQQYSFTYYYGNGETYSGYFYDYDSAYYVGQFYYYSTSANQTGYDGAYYISQVANTSLDSSFVGLVAVSSYYDSDYSGASWTPYNYSQGLVSGTRGLGSELDSVAVDRYNLAGNYTGTDYYQFGQDFYEADVVVRPT